VYQALKGGSTLASFVKFLGFTEITVDTENNSISSVKPQTSSKTRLGLVFDYASGGTLVEYLKTNLQPGQPIHSWGEICVCLLEVSRGLEEIHRNAIVHR
jgi:serine/threonine protein kinase